jgi:thymidylate synthase
MFKTFEARTADLLFQQIRSEYLSGDFYVGRGSRSGTTSEILHAALTIAEPRQRWVHSRFPALNIAFALAEVIWIIRGREDSAFLNYFNRNLPKYAGTGSIYHGAYGNRLRKQFGFDQLERAYFALKHNPDSRQIVLQIWNPASDFPSNNGSPTNEDIPCNVTALLKVRDGKLEWLQVMRSNDLYRGLPYNLVQFTTLHEILSGWLGLGLGQYHHLSDSLHIYHNTTQDILDSKPVIAAISLENRDNLAIEKSESDSAFQLLEGIVERLIAENISTEQILSEAKPSLPQAYFNIAIVLCAESARRRGQTSLSYTMIEECTNPAFAICYKNWLTRVTTRVAVS